MNQPYTGSDFIFQIPAITNLLTAPRNQNPGRCNFVGIVFLVIVFSFWGFVIFAILPFKRK